MQYHIALYKWKPTADNIQVDKALATIKGLAAKIPGISDIQVSQNSSRYSEGYTHIILVCGADSAAIEAYRRHPDHTAAAAVIEAAEKHGIGVDFASS